MTEQNKADMPELVDPSTVTSQDMLTHFSPETLDLIGDRKATELLDIRTAMQSGIADSNERSRRLQQREDPLELDEFLSDQSVAYAYDELDETYREYAKAGRPLQAAGTLYEMSIVYRAHKTEEQLFVPDKTAIEQVVDREEEYTRQTALLEQEVKGLFISYDNAADQGEKDKLVRRIAMTLANMGFPPLSEQQAGSLANYLTAQAIFSKFEQLEVELGAGVRSIILQEFSKQSLFKMRPRDETKTYEFSSLGEIAAWWNRLKVIGLHRASLHPMLDDYQHRSTQLVQETSKRQLTQIMAVAAGAVALAKSVLLESHEDLDSYPYSELNPDQEDYSKRVKAIKIFSGAPLLASVCREVKSALTEFEFSVKEDLARYAGAWQTIVGPTQEEQQSAEAEARQIVDNIVKRSLDDLHDQLKPYAAIATGQKPRVPKRQNKAVQSSHSVASSVYDQLHREGDFTRLEQALIASIISGDWEKICNARDTVHDRYSNIATFTEEHGLKKVLDGHPVTKVMQFSPDDTLNEARTKISRLSSDMLNTLTAEQRQRLQDALDQVANP